MQLLLVAVLCNILGLFMKSTFYGLFCFGVFMFICCLVVILSCLWITDIYIGVFLQLTPPPPIPLVNLRGPKYQKKNWPTSGPQQLFHEISHLSEPIFISVLNRGARESLRNTLCKYEAALAPYSQTIIWPICGENASGSQHKGCPFWKHHWTGKSSSHDGMEEHLRNSTLRCLSLTSSSMSWEIKYWHPLSRKRITQRYQSQNSNWCQKEKNKTEVSKL